MTGKVKKRTVQVWMATVLTCLVAGASPSGADDAALELQLRFEVESSADAPLPGWGGGPEGTLFLDHEMVHAGAGAARLERDAESDGQFTALTKVIEVDFAGREVELRGVLRVEGVTERASLWMRQDGVAGSVDFVSLESQGRALSGTADWSSQTIRSPLNEGARRLFFGATLSGQGRAWVDDLEILVDGKPLSEAPKRTFEQTVLETDTAFDAGSGIDLASVTPAQVENLAVLGRVWGFLKYHHPRVTSGAMHWDFELFRVLPKVLAAADHETGRRVLTAWVESISIPEPCTDCLEPSDDPHLAAPIDWIHDHALLGPALADHLTKIHARRPKGTSQFFVGKVPNVGNPVFEHELPFPSMQPPDAGFRLLALFRYWNIIEYWFPYRNQIDDDWPTVLREFVPRVVDADDWDAYRLAMLALIVRIRDTHANLWAAMEVVPPRGACRWPVVVRYVERQFVVMEHLEAAESTNDSVDDPGFAIGDIVRSIDGTRIESLIDSWSPYYAASNETGRMHSIAAFLSRGACGPGRAGIERNGAPRAISVERRADVEVPRRLNDRPGDTFQRLVPPSGATDREVGDIAYLKLSSVEIAKIDQYLEQAEGTRGLVIDIRNYPSEFVVFALGTRLIDEATPFVRFTAGDLANPGAFHWGHQPIFLPKVDTGTHGPLRYTGNVAILVDWTSLSQAEYTAMAFSASPRAVVVGSTTAGADGNVSRVPLPGGLTTGISGIGVFYPDRRPTQRVGVDLDIEVEPTVEGLRAGRDEVLEAAIRHLLGAEVDSGLIEEMAKRPE